MRSRQRPVGLVGMALIEWMMGQTVETPAPYPNLETPCRLWSRGKNRAGYGSLAVVGMKSALAHRVVRSTLDGIPIPSLPDVLHLCDRPSCIESTHLMLGDDFLNQQQVKERGRSNPRRGSANHASKLTEIEALAIRQSSVLLLRELAAHFNVTQETIESIRYGRGWKHATPEWCLSHLTNLDDETILDLIAATEETEVA